MPEEREKKETPNPKPDGAPHKVDEAAQEKAGKERSETGGYE